MMCPFCGEEMREGNVVTDDSIGLFFLPPGESTSIWCNSTRSIEKKDGVVLDGPHYFRFNHTELPAFLCEKCRRVILAY